MKTTKIIENIIKYEKEELNNKNVCDTVEEWIENYWKDYDTVSNLDFIDSLSISDNEKAVRQSFVIQHYIYDLPNLYEEKKIADMILTVLSDNY